MLMELLPVVSELISLSLLCSMSEQVIILQGQAVLLAIVHATT